MQIPIYVSSTYSVHEKLIVFVDSNPVDNGSVPSSL